MKEINTMKYFDIFERDKRQCVLCGSGKWLESKPHHCFYRSEYFKDDLNGDWNLITICKKCHWEIHHNGNKKKQRMAKEVALSRYSGKYLNELNKIMAAKGFTIT